MRASPAFLRGTLLGVLLLSACGGEAGSKSASAEGWPVDGFLRLLPPEPSLVVRFPPAGNLAERPAEVVTFLRLMGRQAASASELFTLVPGGEGIDPARGAALVLGPGDAWARYLPAADKGALNRALSAQAARIPIREEGDWIVLSGGVAPAPPAGQKGSGGEPLPPGDLALRIHHHPLLQPIASPGDRLDLGCELAQGGISLLGRYFAAPEGESARLLGAATAGTGGLLDLLPGNLALRVETTLPPAMLASFATSRLALACGIREAGERVVIERMIREALTAIDPKTGIAFGFEFVDGETSFVLLGRLASSPPSPLLAKVRKAMRWSCGALVLDSRPLNDLTAFSAWVAQSEASLEGVPESAWSLVGALCGGEEAGLPLAYAEHESWFVFAGGKRGDTLARSVRRRLEQGTTRSPGSQALMEMRDRGTGDYVMGIVFGGQGPEGLAPADRATLRDLFGAGPNAVAPYCAGLAVFREGSEPVARLYGRLIYGG